VFARFLRRPLVVVAIQNLAAKLDDVNGHLARIEGILAASPPSAPAKDESGRSEV